MYDLAIIGGGPAGYSAALAAAGYGLKTVLFEKECLGGTCLNRGCVPTKTLLHAAELYNVPAFAARYGITFSRPEIDFSATIAEMHRIVGKLRDDLSSLLASKKIEVVIGDARVVAVDMVSAAHQIYHVKNLLIATGSRPVSPFLDGAATSDEVLRSDRIPASVKIIGGGIVAVEFAQIFQMLGSRVTLCLRSDRILRRWDKEISVSLTQHMKQQGISILPNLSPEQMKKIEAEVTLSAIGRTPVVEGILETNIGLEIQEGIVVDLYGRTNVKGVYAAGDVTAGSVQLAHTAMAQGKTAAAAIAGADLLRPSTVVHCIYAQPEIASVGLTEAEAKQLGIPVVIGKQTMMSNARTVISSGQRGFIKLVADIGSRKLLGAQLYCERAGDIAAELVLAINQEITVGELSRSVRPHPSFCEAVTEAADNLLKKL